MSMRHEGRLNQHEARIEELERQVEELLKDKKADPDKQEKRGPGRPRKVANA